MTALERYQSGPRAITVQLCLAVSGLALQLPQWTTPVQDMIDRFGRIPAMVPTLLEFLTLLPEELGGNTKIPITDDEYRERAGKLLTGNSRQILDLLAMYIQASGKILYDAIYVSH
jgi:transportin-3